MKPPLDFRSIAKLTLVTLSLACVTNELQATDLKSTTLHLADTQIAVKKVQSLNDNTQITFELDQASRQFAAENIVRFGSRRVPPKFSSLILIDGSLIAGNWLGTSQGLVRWESNTFGTLDVPLAFVRALVLKPIGGLKSWLDLEQTILSDNSNTDRLLIDDAGWNSGILGFPGSGNSGFDVGPPNAIVELKTEQKNLTLPVNKIQCIIFSAAFAPNAQLDSSLQLGFRDGTLLRTSGWSVDSQSVCRPKLAIPLDLALPVTEQSAGQISYLLAAPAGVRFLSSEKPASFRHLPQWSTKLELGVNQTVFGEPLHVDNAVFARGLAMPGSSQASFRIDGSRQKLIAELVLPEVHDADQRVGSVVAKVLVSKNRRLETVYTSETLQAGDPPVLIKADVSGGELLVLLVEPANRGDAGDQLFWIDCRLVESKEEK
jgi:NPCBM/NEW2 domain